MTREASKQIEYSLSTLAIEKLSPSREAMKLCEQMSDGEISTEAAVAAIINRYSSRRMKHNV